MPRNWSRAIHTLLVGTALVLAAGWAAPWVRAANDGAGRNDSEAQNDSEPAAERQPTVAPECYRELVLADRPAAYWSFEGSAEGGAGLAVAGLAAGKLTTLADGTLGWRKAGPRPPAYPLFAADNEALELAPRAVGYLRVADPGAGSLLDFDLGDSLTIEAWLYPEQLPASGFGYIVGKGRTQRPGQKRDNQNYALRLDSKGGSAALSFLFRSGGAEGQWHRWTSAAEVPLDDVWHHVAVSYTFGKPESMRGYVDGQPVDGTWDMGGATDRGPVVDDDELWIGSSMGGSKTSTFGGLLDEVALYRAALPAERIAARYQFAAPPEVVDYERIPAEGVLVDIYERIGDKKSWSFRRGALADSYEQPWWAFFDVAKKYSPRGVQEDRSNPFLLRASGWVTLPEGEHRLLVRCRNASRVSIDGRRVAETPFHSIGASGHGKILPIDTSLAPRIRPLARGDSETVAVIKGDGQRHLVEFEVIVGGQKHRPELGETGVFLGSLDGDFYVLGSDEPVMLSDEQWPGFAAGQRVFLAALDARRRREAGAEETAYWQQRHKLARQYLAAQEGVAAPEPTAGLPRSNQIDDFLNARLAAEGQRPAELTDDLALLRRLSLDVAGRIPTPEEIEAFLREPDSRRRAAAIERLLADEGWADNWVGYWQDVLAENPNIINPTLNNTGPFRWWIHESFVDNKPFDRFATELVMMEGSEYYGGPAGFAMATQNDAPMAAKAHIVGQALLGLEMKCARCHDAPYHPFKQEDLFSLAAMLNRGGQKVPETSTIPGGPEAVKSLLVEVTLEPGSTVRPKWTFEDLSSGVGEGVLRDPTDSRERLAALITSPANERFARVIVNRLWKRYFGLGLVEPVDDWHQANASHPELLEWLARELVGNGYDLKHVARLILSSHAYQRRAVSSEAVERGKPYLFAAPLVRRMTAEQLVDSLFLAAGKPFDAGPMNIDIDGARSFTQSLNLGEPTRAWMFASLSNERDRPSLALPFAQPFVTLMETFGWRSARQSPVTVREEEATVLQPAIMANGTLSGRIVRLSEDSAFTALALEAASAERLVEEVYLRILSRRPTSDERETFAALLGEGFAQRRIEGAEPAARPRLRRNVVAWSNHLHPEANVIKTELEEAVRQGDPPTTRLATDWRQRMEDMVWALTNSPEFVFLP